MPRTAVVGAAIVCAVVGCASAPAVKPVLAAGTSSEDLALEVARRGFTEEQYRSIVSAVSQRLQAVFEKLAARDGRKLPPGVSAIVAEITGEELPYSYVVDLQADFYRRNYTEAELKELLAIRQSAVVQKEMRLLMQSMKESGQRVQERLLARRPEMEAKLKARLAILAKQPPE
jgi:hypothetical protein